MTRTNTTIHVLPLCLGMLLAPAGGCGQDDSAVEYVGAHSFIIDVNEPMVGPVPSVSAFRGSVVVRRTDNKVSIGLSPSCTLTGILSGGNVALDGEGACTYQQKFLPSRCWLRSSTQPDTQMSVRFTAPVTLTLTKQGKVSVRAAVEIPNEQDYLCKGQQGKSTYLFDGEESAL